MERKLSPFLAEVRRILADGIRRIDEGDDSCDDAKAAALLSRFNAESKGFYDKNSFVNYDKAMKILGIKNRNAFKAVCDANHIEQKKFNNMPVGFLRSEIEDLRNRMINDKKKAGV